MGVDRLCRMHPEILLHGEQPAHRLVTGESAVEQHVDQTGVMLRDTVVVEEQRGDTGRAGVGHGQQMMIAHQCAHTVR